jgi:hypothetical protein
MSGTPQHVKKPHNKTLFIYHLVCPVKYRRDVFTDAVSQTLKEMGTEEMGQKWGQGQLFWKWGQGQLFCDLCGLICGHESLSIFVRCTPNLLSVLDPTSSIFFLGREENMTAVVTEAASNIGCLLRKKP